MGPPRASNKNKENAWFINLMIKFMLKSPRVEYVW